MTTTIWSGLEISAQAVDGLRGDTAHGTAFEWDATDIKLDSWRMFVNSFGLGELRERPEWRVLRRRRRSTDTLPEETREWLASEYADEITSALAESYEADVAFGYGEVD